MITTIIFDYGGVLSAEESLKAFGSMYAKKLGKNPDAFNDVIIKTWLKARVNEIPSAIFWKTLSDFLEIDAVTFRTDFMKFFGFREEVFDLVKKLKKNGYQLGLLSNQIEDWLEEIIEARQFRKIFDVIVTSYNAGVAKPDIRIFEKIVEKLNANPNKCVYIDDLEKNIPPAQKMGMHAIHFTTYENLKQELAALSIKFD